MSSQAGPGVYLRIWAPGVLVVISIVLAVSTSVNPWIIGACTGTLILLSLGADWLIRREKRRNVAESKSADR